MNVHTTLEGGIALVRMDRPPANAMEPGFLEEIATTFEALAADSSARAIILTGTGRVFSAGLDLKRVPDMDAAGSDAVVLTLNRAFAAVYGLEKPVIGALNGHAIAGGMVLALCCDYRIAQETGAMFGLTEVRVGVPFPEVAYAVIADQLPPQTLRRMIQFGRNMDASAALQSGAVDELVPAADVLRRAREMALACLAIPARGYAEVKKQLRGPVIERNQMLVSSNQDKYLGRWIDDCARRAALEVLKGS
jgi:enoyl-CoA hydratase